MIGLVGCGAKKLDRPARARELYTSVLFRKALAYAESRCSCVYVLSALHGLLALDVIVKPYNRTLTNRKERDAWARRCAGSLIAWHGREVEYLLLAGGDYAGPLATALRTHDGWFSGVPEARILRPLTGKSVGLRLQWLNEQMRGAA